MGKTTWIVGSSEDGKMPTVYVVTTRHPAPGLRCVLGIFSTRELAASYLADRKSTRPNDRECIQEYVVDEECAPLVNFKRVGD